MRMKSTFTPKFCKFKDKNGRRIPASQYASAAADYLADVQWAKAQDPPPSKDRPNIELEGMEIKDEDFELGELDYVIGKLSNNKTPGPDAVKTELEKWMDSHNRRALLG